MTETAWLQAVSPGEMLAHVRTLGAARSLRLFACAVCHRLRRVSPRPAHPCLERAVDAAERFADGLVCADELAFWQHESAEVVRWIDSSDLSIAYAACTRADAAEAARLAAEAGQRAFAWLSPAEEDGLVGLEKERLAQVALVRELVGNPFQPVAFSPLWRLADEQAALRLGAMIYAHRLFEQLPFLADALEDAGCTDEAVLSHCRHTGGHFRGCWALDLVLDRTGAGGTPHTDSQGDAAVGVGLPRLPDLPV